MWLILECDQAQNDPQHLVRHETTLVYTKAFAIKPYFDCSHLSKCLFLWAGGGVWSLDRVPVSVSEWLLGPVVLLLSNSTIIHKYWDGNAVYPQALSQMASNDCSNSNLYDTLERVAIAI